MIRAHSAPYHWFDGDSIFVALRRRGGSQRRCAATGLPNRPGSSAGSRGRSSIEMAGS